MTASNIGQRLKVLILEDDFIEYSRLFSEMKEKSIYFLPSYLRSVQHAEKYPLEIMVFVEHGKIAMIPYIKRRINDLPLFRELRDELWDIITPHEYSGAISNVTDAPERNHIIQQLFRHVQNYCGKENIVSEFVRFDPFLTDTRCMELHYALRKACDNVYIDLRKESIEIYHNFHPSVRKNVNRALTAGLTFSQSEKTDEDVDLFVELYWASMQRLGADDYFYFSVDYFRALIKDCEGASLFVVRDESNQPIAASILLHYGNIGHHHLTGYAADSTPLRPNDYMIYSLINWGKSNNLQCLHLGGGAQSISDFKAKFSNERIPYYVGYKIHNQEAYQLLCDIWRKENNFSQHSDYFPLYRLGQG